MAKRRDLPPTEALTSNPFAALAQLRDALPEGEPVSASDEPTPAPRPEPRGPARAVVRYQRKGRGGKEATIVEQLGLSSEQLDVWCREFKRALGCGGGVEGEQLVFGGDQRARIGALLEAKGVRRIIVG
jgi:translation initiation factor 1